MIGDAVQLSGDDSSGFNISVSSDLGTKIETAYNGCSSVTDECYQRINNLLGSADLEINGQINRRDFAAFLSKTFKSLASLRGVMAAIIYSILRANFGPEPQPKPLPLQYNVPAAVAIEASVFGSLAPVTISLSGSPVITVTPTAVQSTLQG